MTRRPVLILLLVLAAAAVGLVGNRWVEARARSSADRAAEALAHTQVGLLASELQKFRLLPLVLTEHPDMALAMGAGPAARVAEARGRLDRTLELLAGRTDAAAIYAIARDGRTVAASNWRLPTSFVGQDYGFRPYFAEAMRRGASELFALGTVSGRPGLYLARRVQAGGAGVGVIVVKVEFDALEANWARAAGPTIATDAHGVVLVTSVPGWRFTATGPLDRRTLADARRTLQFGSAPPPRTPIRIDGRAAKVATVKGPIVYRAAAVPAPLAGGRLVFLMPLRPALAAARAQALLWLLGLGLLGGTLGGLAVRAAEKRRLQREARAMLEAEVARRTLELRDANARLTVESEERAEAERRFRDAREALAQANRLGSLGQIVAGVAHEINQPVAAIRTFAENGTVLLDREAPERTRENLGHIVALADRIGAITAELRAFARRRTPAMEAVALGDVLDGVHLLMGDARAGIAFDVPADLRALRIVGDRVRLEQVLVNLLRNACEATGGRADAAIAVSAAEDAPGRLAIRVADKGPGVPANLRDGLFAPFTSGSAEGLGLGLAIARTIAREFGGDLVLEASPGPGATFCLTVPLA